MAEPITDFRIGEFNFTQQQFWALPPKVQALLQMYGTEETQGWGKPSIIRVPVYRLPELEAAMKEITK